MTDVMGTGRGTTLGLHALVLEHLRTAQIPRGEELAALAEPAYRITARRAALSDLPLGASRFGGSPDAPAGFAWPTHRGRNLTFLAQLDLGEIEAESLARTGWLLFFYDDAEQPWGFDPLHAGGARVFHLSVAREMLCRIEHPDVSSAGGPCACCALSFERYIHLPELLDLVVTNAGISLSEEQAARYSEIAHRLAGGSADAPQHHLLGHPRLIQGDMRSQCQLLSRGIYCGDPRGYQDKRTKELLDQAAAEWRLLLELDTDAAGPDWLWGDDGRVYFWIRRADLAQGNFDRAWLILQSA
jgi:uncharacterized protein YwqG